MKLTSALSANSRGKSSERNRVGVVAQGAEAKIFLDEKNNLIIILNVKYRGLPLGGTKSFKSTRRKKK